MTVLKKSLSSKVFVWDRAREKVVEQPLVVIRPTGDTQLALNKPFKK
jgi:hypothetical protein